MGKSMKMSLEELKEYVEQINPKMKIDWRSGHICNNSGYNLKDIIPLIYCQKDGNVQTNVYSVKREGYNEQFMMFSGYHGSFGIDWSSCENPQLCEPKEVTRVEYFPL